jgi:hypothetical protein
MGPQKINTHRKCGKPERDGQRLNRESSESHFVHDIRSTEMPMSQAFSHCANVVTFARRVRPDDDAQTAQRDLFV